MRKFLKWTFFSVAIITMLVIIVGGLFINSIMDESKNIKFDKTKLISSTTQITLLDNENNDFTENAQVVKPVVKIEDLPVHIQDSFISVEDKRFFEHGGLDYKRIAKAMYNNVISGSFREGASTISQQLIKNTHLSQEKTLKRKIKEMLLTKKLEKEFSKKDILETYLNVIYFGEGAYGIEQASQVYFSKPATNLSISESALLAGIIKSPAKYSPIYEKENALNRRNLVLKLMFDNNKITQTQYENAISEDINLNLSTNKPLKYNLYAKAVLNEASKILNLSEKDTASSGLKIYTYLNTKDQNALENAINNDNNYHVNSFGNIADSLGIIINNQTSGITAYAGKSKYNLVNFKRQPGSVIKPILVYAPAMEKGLINPTTQILDEEVDFNGYKPKNVGNVYHDYVSVKESISKSLNIPAVKVLEYVGIDNAKRFAKNAGIEFSENDNGLAIALGGLTHGNTLKEITNSYLPFVNGGMFKNASFIKKIETNTGKVLYEHSNVTKQVMGNDTAFLITDTLIDGVKNGTSKKLSSLPYQVAGKTGTVSLHGTNLNTDAYSVAYTTQNTMGVWLGNYSNNKEFMLESKNNGGTFATNIILETFSDIYQNSHPLDFEIPDSVVKLEIDAKTLQDEHTILLPDENCPERYREKAWFSKRYLPTEISTVFSNLEINDFNVNYENNKAIISFEAKDYLKYEVYKQKNYSKAIKLFEMDNKKGLIEFADTELQPSTKYSYYIKVINTYSNIYNVSDPIVILTNSENIKYENLIEKFKQNFNKNMNENNEKISWYFQ